MRRIATAGPRLLAPAIAVGAMLGLAGCGPVGPLSGGRLSGELRQEPVSDWSFSDAHENVQLETNAAEPHSVNTWCAAHAGNLYVPTSMIRGPKSPEGREWVRNVQADPHVRVRIDGALYERRAVRVTDPAEIEAVRAKLEAKYGLDPAERDPEREIWIFRLEPRGAAAGASSELEAEMRRAAAAVTPFQQSLQRALQEGLAQGPEVALDVCRVRAPQIAAGASSPGIRLGRTSHKLRNPGNAAAPWMEPLLAAYVANPAETAPRAVRLPDGGVGYVQPIFVQPPCLTCHGESIAPEIQARIAALYPEDRATGFRVGDFRGLFWVELAAASAGPPSP